MSKTIREAPDNMGGTVQDISDQDTPDLFSGKVTLCTNYGSVLGDLNVGGITGAMAMENDLDIWEDWQLSGDDSMNFTSEVRAVILLCSNKAPVTGKKQNVGGITGWQSLGLIHSAISTGEVHAEAGEFIGGIAGSSSGYIRCCYAKCAIWGSSATGGIAGSAAIATDCRAMVTITGCTEKQGGILGCISETGPSQKEEEKEPSEPIRGNYYLAPRKDPGGIDGISFEGLAQPLPKTEFLALEGLPEEFRKVTIVFLQEDGREYRRILSTGDALEPSRIPAVPEKPGYTGIWKGLSEADCTCMLFDQVFEAEYTMQNPTLASAVLEDHRPLALAEGSFHADAVLTIEEAEADVPVPAGTSILAVWQVDIPEGTQALRLLQPGEDTPEILVLSDDGSWQATDVQRNGSYLVISITSGEVLIAVIQPPRDFRIPAVIAGAALLAGGLVLVLRRKKNRKKQTKTDSPDVTE